MMDENNRHRLQKPVFWLMQDAAIQGMLVMGRLENGFLQPEWGGLSERGV
jgi:hypothetical protein